MTTKAVILAGVFFAIIGAKLRAQDAPVFGSHDGVSSNCVSRLISENITRLGSVNEETRAEAMKALSSWRKETTGALIYVLENDTNVYARINAAHLLGEYRAVEAAGSLVRNLMLTEFTENNPRVSIVTEERRSPAGSALVQIGNAAVPLLIAKIGDSDHIRIRRACLYQLSKIEEDKEILRDRVKKALDEETLESRRTNLQWAVRHLSKSLSAADHEKLAE